MKTFDELLAGYGRFRDGQWRDQQHRWEQLKEGQSPQVLVIACSDSRADPALIFDVDPGEIFVIRNVAAMVPPFETTSGQHGVSAALEFAVQFLEVRDVVVMGHGSCGGCQAALTRDLHGAEPGAGGFVAQWMRLLDGAREPIARELGTAGPKAAQAMEQAAVRVSLENLRTFPWVREREKNGSLALHGAHFAISDGILRVLDPQSGRFDPV